MDGIKVFSEGKSNNAKTFVNLCDIIDENTDPVLKTKSMGKYLKCKSVYDRQSGRSVFSGTWTRDQIIDALLK